MVAMVININIYNKPYNHINNDNINNNDNNNNNNNNNFNNNNDKKVR